MSTSECYFNIPSIDENTNFWMVRTKRGFFFDEFITKGFIAIGWNSITKSMVNLSLSKDQSDRLKENIKEDYGENKPGTSLNKCIRFCHELKSGDIAVIVDNGRIAFAYIGDYYEDLSPDFTVENEIEIHRQIEKATPSVDNFTCPYVKRRRIEVIKVIGDNDTVSPYLQSAIARNWHSLSDLNDHAETVLSGCFDTFVFDGKLTLTFRVLHESNTWLRVALDIEGEIDVGDEFVHCGYVFTALSKNLAISNNFLGCAKYFDEEMCPYIKGVGRIPPFNECTLGDVIYTMICVEDEDDYEVIEEDDSSVEVFGTIDDETRVQLGVLDLDD